LTLVDPHKAPKGGHLANVERKNELTDQQGRVTNSSNT